MIQASARVGRGLIMPLAFLIALVAAFLATPTTSSAQGLTFTVSPSARWIEWDEDLGFKQSRLFGGSVGMGFGRYVGLQAFHHQADGLKLFEATEGDETPQLFDLAKSGLQVSLALGSGTFVPIVVGGGSLLKFQPKDGDELKKLTLDYGAGFRVVLSESLHGEVLVESTQFRLDPVFLATGEPSFEGTGPLRRNMTLRASLGLQFGRRSFDKATELDDAFAQRYQAPFSNFALAIEPLIGRLDYDKSIDLDNQEMVGIRAGVDFGSFFGLRGFHWWGTDSDFGSTTDLKAYGGEAQFTLASGPGLNPYLLGGAGELTWGKAEEGQPALPSDQTALILGGGVDFNFGPRVRATVAARDFILSGSDLSASPDLNTISNPDDLVHNWQFSAGLKFLVGRSGIRSAKPAAPKVSEAPAPAMGEPAQGAEKATEAMVQPTPDRPTVVVVPQAAPAAPTTPPVATAGAVAPSQMPAQGMPAGAIEVRVDTIIKVTEPANTIVLPILERGEIYIRFGEPGSVPLVTTLRPQGEAAPPAAPAVGQAAPTLEDLRRLIQDELGRQPERPAMDPESLRDLESRLLRRLDEVEAAARRAEAAASNPAPVVVTREPEVVVVTREPDTVVVTRASGTSDSMERRVEELRPYTGFNLTGDFQALIGIGVDIGPIKPGSRFRLVPQAALGFGQGPASLMVSADVEYRFPDVDAGRRLTLEPLVSIGPGLIKRDKMELQLGMFLGTGARFYESNGREKLHLFGGIQGVDFFDDTRFIIGMRRLR